MILKLARATCTYSAISSSVVVSYLKIRFNNIYYRKKSLEDRKKINLKSFVNTTSYFINLLYWIKYDFQGKKIDFEKTNCILVANHISYFDLFVFLNLYNKHFINYEKLYFITDTKIF